MVAVKKGIDSFLIAFRAWNNSKNVSRVCCKLCRVPCGSVRPLRQEEEHEVALLL